MNSCCKPKLVGIWEGDGSDDSRSVSTSSAFSTGHSLVDIRSLVRVSIALPSGTSSWSGRSITDGTKSADNRLLGGSTDIVLLFKSGTSFSATSEMSGKAAFRFTSSSSEPSLGVSMESSSGV